MSLFGPELFTFSQVLELLKGRIGRTNLTKHLKAVPVFSGGPTHRKNGTKYLFTARDIERLVDSLVVPPNEADSCGQRDTPPARFSSKSDQRQYENALRLLSDDQPSKTRGRKAKSNRK
jgi:hypothetical protein